MMNTFFGFANQIIFETAHYSESIELATKKIDGGKLLFKAYESRSITRSFIGDQEGALKDLKAAIKTDPLHEGINIYAIVYGLEKSKE